MTEVLHDPKPLQQALEPHAKRLGETACGSCGRTAGFDELDNEEVHLDLYVLPLSNGIHATPQLNPLCNDCAMEVADALAALYEP